MKGYYAGNEYWERYVLLNNAYKKNDSHCSANRRRRKILSVAILSRIGGWLNGRRQSNYKKRW